MRALFIGLCLMCSLNDVLAEPKRAEATFAGGCFWCMQPPFDKLDGVLDTVVGYAGGQEKNPTYEQVSSGTTGHTEAMRVVYDPQKISYQELLRVFWHNIDPLVANRQFCDAGTQYRSEIFAHDDDQLTAAQESLAEIEKSKRFEQPIKTKISRLTSFYPAEDYHQDYYKKNPLRYKYYRYMCGRDARLAELWGE
jgi:peptide-methionine (S)-S-oxide reductase